MKRRLFSALMVVLFPAVAFAQMMENPSAVIFTPSPSHDAMDLGVPVLAEYVLEFLEETGATPMQSLPIAKPTPVNNEITVNLTALRPQLKLKPGPYVLRVAARGPGGEARSNSSVPFVLKVLPPTAPGPASFRILSALNQTPTSSGSQSLMAAETLRIGEWSPDRVRK
jgi:hypothetical protein